MLTKTPRRSEAGYSPRDVALPAKPAARRSDYHRRIAGPVPARRMHSRGRAPMAHPSAPGGSNTTAGIIVGQVSDCARRSHGKACGRTLAHGDGRAQATIRRGASSVLPQCRRCHTMRRCIGDFIVVERNPARALSLGPVHGDVGLVNQRVAL